MSLAENDPSLGAGKITASQRFFRARLLDTLHQLHGAEIHVHDVLGTLIAGQHAQGETDTLRVNLHIHDLDFYREVALGGSNGAAEAYMDGLWHCDDLVTLIRIFVRNRELLDRMERGLARMATHALKWWHALNRNSRTGSKRNIAAHYDLGNAMFELFLDQNLMYSSAIYTHANESLESAQTRKLARICEKLGLRPGMHVVEIGTGWGGFAMHAAKHHGVHVTTTTISAAQYNLAKSRVHEAGLNDRITLLQQDYRDLIGTFDRLVSIEMIEAIGHQYQDVFFRQVGDLLKPDGMAVIQAITIEDHRYDIALREVDFIKRYVFPGSYIPAIGSMLGSVARNTDLKLFHLEDIGPSYALTLREWRRRFNAKLPAVRAQGHDERFIRLWNWYLAYCEGGFMERAIGDVQMLLVKPGARPATVLTDLERIASV